MWLLDSILIDIFQVTEQLFYYDSSHETLSQAALPLFYSEPELFYSFWSTGLKNYLDTLHTYHSSGSTFRETVTYSCIRRRKYDVAIQLLDHGAKV